MHEKENDYRRSYQESSSLHHRQEKMFFVFVECLTIELQTYYKRLRYELEKGYLSRAETGTPVFIWLSPIFKPTADTRGKKRKESI